MPVLGELTEYQRGVANGLKIGLYMGELHGKGQYSTDYAIQFNTYLDSYKKFLIASLGNNQTLVNEFMLSIIQNAVNESSTSASTTSQSQIKGDIF
jgi:hypothetical protein